MNLDEGSPPSGIDELRRFWMSCLAQFMLLLTNSFKLNGSPKVSLEGVVRTKCHIYVFF